LLRTKAEKAAKSELRPASTRGGETGRFAPAAARKKPEPRFARSTAPGLLTLSGGIFQVNLPPARDWNPIRT